MSRHKEYITMFETPVGSQLLVRPLRPEDNIGHIAPDVTETDYPWTNIWVADIPSSSVQMAQVMQKIGNLWGKKTDVLVTFRGGSAGIMQTARIIGFNPGSYVEPGSGNVTGNFLRMFMECDPVIMGTPPPLELA